MTLGGMSVDAQDLTELAWRDRAACLTHPATLFFGFDESEPPGERRSREDQAKLICSTCLVRDDCLSYALDANESYGIWGGLTEMELKARRRALKSRTALTPQ